MKAKDLTQVLSVVVWHSGVLVRIPKSPMNIWAEAETNLFSLFSNTEK
jgi:hypothetical protein